MLRVLPAGAPTSTKERIHELDILRGFALLGILMSNIAFFASPAIFLPQTDLEWWTDPWNHTAKLILEFLSSSKFLTLFSFLFGLGFVLFLQRAYQKTDRPRLLFLKRLLLLLIFGLIHSFGIWSGDILLTYALLGPVLLLFYPRRPGTLLVWALALLLVPALLMGTAAVGISLSGEEALPEAVGAAYSERLVEQSIAAYGSGRLADIFRQRVTDLLHLLNGYTIVVPLIFSMFLFGVYAAKTKRHVGTQHQLPFYRKLWWTSLCIGLPFNVLYIYSLEMSVSSVSVYTMTSLVGILIGWPALCFFYIASIILLCQKKAWLPLLSLLQPVGRASLSSYLLQSVICTLIFYSYGLGLYGRLGPLQWMAVVAVVFALQVGVSRLWMNAFQFGPAEWLWRSWTYSRWQPWSTRSRTAEGSAAKLHQ